MSNQEIRAVAVFYRTDTGDITMVSTSADPDSLLEEGQDYVYMELEGDPARYRIDPTTRRLIEKPPELPRSWTWHEIRRGRDMLLASSDWTQMPDADLTPQQVEEARVYRQRLRDLTELYNHPDVVVFPDLPAFMIKEANRG